MTPSWTRSTSSALLLGLALALSATALGADPKKGKADPDETKARALFKEAQTAYDLGEFTHALQLYSDAYKLKALPGFLFNIAQCHRQLGNFKDAQFFYGRYIDNSSAKEPNVARARELLEDMKQKQADAEKKAEEEQRAEEARKAELKRDAPVATTLTPADAPPPPPLLVAVEDPPVYKKGWFWAVVGGGVAVVAAGTVTAIVLTRPQTVTPPTRPPTTLPDIR